MNVTKREFLKTLLSFSAIGVLSPKELLLSGKTNYVCGKHYKCKNIKIKYEETEWFYPVDTAAHVKTIIVCRPHILVEKQMYGYCAYIAITDREIRLNQQIPYDLYLMKKKQALLSLYDRIQNIEGLNGFVLVKND